MKAIMMMFDTLSRRFLPPYGCSDVHAPNFARLAERAVTFTNSYAGSMPCMPARREIHTGRYNMLHRSWSPLEPFDDSMPEMLSKAGVYTHLVSDHYHYWEDGGATYHTRYNSWDASRGQEGDPWKAEVRDPEIPECVTSRKGPRWRGDWVNRKYIEKEEDWPQAKTMAGALEFLETNHAEDGWFLHVETFDPHEPFYVPGEYEELYPHDYKGKHFDWPEYGRVKETPEEVEHLRRKYSALVSFCDAQLGRLLDEMDRRDLWKDTMLIVNTDHGFLLGEKGWWAKCTPPMYNEVIQTPFFIWDPRSGHRNERRDALVQTIDIAPTLLEFFGVERTPDMLGAPLGETVASDRPVREAALFGCHSMHISVTDGRYVYMRAPDTSKPVYNYTLMPTHMNRRFSVEELRGAELAPPFSFTKGCPVLKIPAARQGVYETMLFDLSEDPQQERPIRDEAVEARMTAHMVRLMKENDAPEEVYERYGLSTG